MNDLDKRREASRRAVARGHEPGLMLPGGDGNCHNCLGRGFYEWFDTPAKIRRNMCKLCDGTGFIQEVSQMKTFDEWIEVQKRDHPDYLSRVKLPSKVDLRMAYEAGQNSMMLTPMESKLLSSAIVEDKSLTQERSNLLEHRLGEITNHD